MTDTQKLEKLLQAGESMRKLQIAYFNEKVVAKRKELLIKAKDAEKHFDSCLFAFSQLSIFN